MLQILPFPSVMVGDQMSAKWKRHLDLFFVATYSVIMVTVVMVLVAVDLWGVAFAQLVAVGLLIRYYREAKKTRP